VLQQQLTSLLAQTDIALTEKQQQQLVQYVELLNKWNKAYNLTSVRMPEEMMIKHIMDSLVVAPHLSGHHYIDVGTGPGLPGIVLAIALPDTQFVLLDSLGKRVRFLMQVKHELGLKNVTPVQSRVEQYQPSVKLDGVLSRAFASLQDMVDWCSHLIDDSGKFIALKGVFPAEELESLPAGVKFEQKIALEVPELDAQRHLIILSKD
jgi:16S rRNA (guanine527-N7)-methyltransferase